MGIQLNHKCDLASGLCEAYVILDDFWGAGASQGCLVLLRDTLGTLWHRVDSVGVDLVPSQLFQCERLGRLTL